MISGVAYWPWTDFLWSMTLKNLSKCFGTILVSHKAAQLDGLLQRQRSKDTVHDLMMRLSVFNVSQLSNAKSYRKQSLTNLSCCTRKTSHEPPWPISDLLTLLGIVGSAFTLYYLTVLFYFISRTIWCLICENWLFTLVNWYCNSKKVVDLVSL